MKDFFSEFHKHSRPQWALSVVFALLLSVGTVGLLLTGSTGLQADVSKSGNAQY